MDRDARSVQLVADPYPPYQFEEVGTVKGIDQETIAEAFAVHGIQVHTALLPWKECLERMADRKADAIFQIAPTPERLRRYLFSDRLREERTILIGGAGTAPLGPGADIRKRLRGRTLGVVQGYTYDSAIEALPSSVKVELETQKALVHALAAASVDLILMDAGVAAYLVKKLGLRGVERVEGYEITAEDLAAIVKARRAARGEEVS